VVTGVAQPVPVDILIVGIGQVGTGIAGIANVVLVTIGLIRVGGQPAVIEVIGNTVTVRIRVGSAPRRSRWRAVGPITVIVRAIVAGIAVAVAVSIELSGVSRVVGIARAVVIAI